MSKPRHNTLQGGEVFGRLTVISYSHTTKRRDGTAGERVMNCRCSCGNTKKVRSSNLRWGNTTSCGCFHSELIIKNNRLRERKQQEVAA